MLIVTKQKVKIQKDIMGFEERQIGFQTSPIMIVGDKGVVNYRVVDGSQGEDRMGRMDFQTRVQGKFELTKEQVLEVVNDETKLFGFVAPHVVEFLSPLNPELTVEGLEEVEQGRRPN